MKTTQASLVGMRSSFILPGTFSVHPQRVLCSRTRYKKVRSAEELSQAAAFQELVSSPQIPLTSLRSLFCASLCGLALHTTGCKHTQIVTRAYFIERNFEESEMHPFAAVAPVN